MLTLIESRTIFSIGVKLGDVEPAIPRTPEPFHFLDPCRLFAPPSVLRRAVLAISMSETLDVSQFRRV